LAATWDGPTEIGFGLDGKPYFIPGPYDDANRILRQLERSAGRDNLGRGVIGELIL